MSRPFSEFLKQGISRNPGWLNRQWAHVPVSGGAAIMCLALLTTGSCGDPASLMADTAVETTPPFNTDLDALEIMAHGVQPAAAAFWAGWGERYDAKGIHDLSAKTEEDWKKVEDGATMVVLAMNTLMLPASQREPKADWISSASKVSTLAMEGRAAAAEQNLVLIESVGERLDEACDTCHETFLAPGQRP